jgi:hypothetical protein
MIRSSSAPLDATVNGTQRLGHDRCHAVVLPELIVKHAGTGPCTTARHRPRHAAEGICASELEGVRSRRHGLDGRALIGGERRIAATFADPRRRRAANHGSLRRSHAQMARAPDSSGKDDDPGDAGGESGRRAAASTWRSRTARLDLRRSTMSHSLDRDGPGGVDRPRRFDPERGSVEPPEHFAPRRPGHPARRSSYR